MCIFSLSISVCSTLFKRESKHPKDNLGPSDISRNFSDLCLLFTGSKSRASAAGTALQCGGSNAPMCTDVENEIFKRGLSHPRLAPILSAAYSTRKAQWDFFPGKPRWASKSRFGISVVECIFLELHWTFPALVMFCFSKGFFNSPGKNDFSLGPARATERSGFSFLNQPFGIVLGCQQRSETNRERCWALRSAPSIGGSHRRQGLVETDVGAGGAVCPQFSQPFCCVCRLLPQPPRPGLAPLYF